MCDSSTVDKADTPGRVFCAAGLWKMGNGSSEIYPVAQKGYLGKAAGTADR